MVTVCANGTEFPWPFRCCSIRILISSDICAYRPWTHITRSFLQWTLRSTDRSPIYNASTISTTTRLNSRIENWMWWISFRFGPPFPANALLQRHRLNRTKGGYAPFHSLTFLHGHELRLSSLSSSTITKPMCKAKQKQNQKQNKTKTALLPTAWPQLSRFGLCSTTVIKKGQLVGLLFAACAMTDDYPQIT